MPPLFVAVTLPGTILVVDSETSGGTFLIRRPSQSEMADLEAAAQADDAETALTIAYGLAGLDLRQVALLGPEARAVLDQALGDRLEEARSADIQYQPSRGL